MIIRHDIYVCNLQNTYKIKIKPVKHKKYPRQFIFTFEITTDKRDKNGQLIKYEVGEFPDRFEIKESLRLLDYYADKRKYDIIVNLKIYHDLDEYMKFLNSYDTTNTYKEWRYNKKLLDKGDELN